MGRTPFVLLGLALATPALAPVSAQGTARPKVAPARAAAAPASPALVADTALHAGKLANGLRYWIRHNSYPEQRLELRLVVRAGSILEDPDQLGLAHFVEHMAFNGTTHFAKNDLIKYLESIGVRFGADLNAQTSFDETTYILPVPSDKPELVERAFDILQDWAMGIKFDSMEVVNERGVVLGEWRSGLGAQTRVFNKELPVLLQGSLYAKRLPIGDTGTIAHANPAPIKRFYHDWYRPDLMAVIAVGDYPTAKIEELIKSRFGAMKAPVKERPRVDAAVPEIPGTRVTIITDPELRTESVQMLTRRPSHKYRTEADERRGIINGLFSEIAGQRMSDLARRPDATFVGAGFGPSGLIRDVEEFSVGIGPKEGKSAAAFEAVLREVRRLGLHGALPAEFDRAKADFLRGRESAAAESGKTESYALVGQPIGTFISGSVAVSAAERFALAQRIVPTITLDELNAAIRDASRGTDRVIVVTGPDKAKTTLPVRDTLLAILARTDTATLSPWTETVVEGPLVPKPPTPGRIVAETTYAEIGVTDWKLSNGVRVLIKPTDFKADQVFVVGGGPGGTSLLADDALMNGELGTAVVGASGVGNFDAPSLARRMAGKVAFILPIVDETSENILTYTAPKDLESALQVLWLNLTAPRLDTAAVSAFKNRVKTQLANRDADPATALADTINLTMNQHSPRVQPMSLSRFETFDPERALASYRTWFSDFSHFTFVIVGAVTPDSIRPLVSRWLGGLPSTGTNAMWKDVKPRPPEGVITKIVHKGKEPVSKQEIYFTGPVSVTGPEAELAASAAAQILEERLMDKLREAMGATYGVNVASSLMSVPHKEYSMMIQFKSTPAQADTLWNAAQELITALRTDGPTADELQKYVAQERRTTEVGIKTNDYWVEAISQHTMADAGGRDRPLADILDWNKRLDALTPAMVRDAARLYLDPARVARFVLLPESPGQP